MITNPSNPKHIKSFWGIVIIFVVGMVAGGIIAMTAFNNQLQDDINSMTFFGHRESKTVKKSTTEQTKAPTTTNVTK
ncbi:MAG: hypothetical protein WC794_05745 [Candidatus Doudnabacteria bacterium]|jgi:hypothetical protein